MPIVELAKTKLEYLRFGKGAPLILLHGFPLDNRIWIRVRPLLEDQFEVILPNLRGFGNSHAKKNGNSTFDMAQDIVELMDALKIKKGIIAGHSMGGYVTLAFADAYPERLLGLGLISTQSLADNSEKKASRYQTATQVEGLGMEVLAESMSDKLVTDQELRKITSEIILSQNKSGSVEALKALAERPDLSLVLKDLQCPTAIIHGNADSLIPVERAEEMHNACSFSSLTILDRTGHMPMLERPTETAIALKRLTEGL